MLASVHIATSIQKALDALLAFIPNLIGFLVILIVGYVIARLIRTVVRRILEKVGVDRALHSGAVGAHVKRLGPSVSAAALIAAVVFWFIFLFVLSAAIGALQIPAVTAFMNTVLGYLPNLVVAVIIFVLAGAIAAAAGTAAVKLMGDTPTGKVVGTVVPILVMGIAVFMILNQLKIAPAIVEITYTALIGSVALGLALAFGLGGRDVAARLLDGAYEKGQENKDQVRHDVELGKDRAQQHATAITEKLDRPGASEPGGSAPA